MHERHLTILGKKFQSEGATRVTVLRKTCVCWLYVITWRQGQFQWTKRKKRILESKKFQS